MQTLTLQAHLKMSASLLMKTFRGKSQLQLLKFVELFRFFGTVAMYRSFCTVYFSVTQTSKCFLSHRSDLLSDAGLRNVPSKQKTIIQLYLDITDILAVFLLIRYIKVFHITSPRYNEPISVVPWQVVKSRFRCSQNLF